MCSGEACTLALPILLLILAFLRDSRELILMTALLLCMVSMNSICGGYCCKLIGRLSTAKVSIILGSSVIVTGLRRLLGDTALGTAMSSRAALLGFIARVEGGTTPSPMR